MLKIKIRRANMPFLIVSAIGTLFLFIYFPFKNIATEDEISYIKSQTPIFEENIDRSLKLHTFEGWNESVNNKKDPWKKQGMRILNNSGREETIPTFSVKMSDHFIIASCTYQTLKYQHHVKCINYKSKYNTIPKQISYKSLTDRPDAFKIQYTYEQDVQSSTVHLVSLTFQNSEKTRVQEFIIRLFQVFIIFYILKFLLLSVIIPILKKRKIRSDKKNGIKNLNTLPTPVVSFTIKSKFKKQA